MFEMIRKRDGRLEKFQPEKITWAIFKAAEACGGSDFKLAQQLCDQVLVQAASLTNDDTPEIEAVQDIIERSNYLNLNSDRKNPLYIYSDAFANQLALPRAHLASESWRTKMKRILTTRKIKLWIIDNLASLASGLDENAKKDWD